MVDITEVVQLTKRRVLTIYVEVVSNIHKMGPNSFIKTINALSRLTLQNAQSNVAVTMVLQKSTTKKFDIALIEALIFSIGVECQTVAPTFNKYLELGP